MKRNPRAMWRGKISGKGHHFEDCYKEAGNYARLQAAELTRSAPRDFDVRVTDCHPRTARDPCPGLRRAVSTGTFSNLRLSFERTRLASRVRP